MSINTIPLKTILVSQEGITFGQFLGVDFHGTGFELFDAGNFLQVTFTGGSTAEPGAPDGTFQWNDGGIFAGAPGFTWDTVNGRPRTEVGFEFSDSGFDVLLLPSTLSADRQIEFPDASGTLALVETSPVIFDPVATNITTTRFQASAIDSTKTGITSFGSDTFGVQGALANYATIVGGDRAVILVTADYATVGGFRPFAGGQGGTAFGISCFADGDYCFSVGKSNVSGAVPTDPVGHKIGAATFGENTQARANHSFAAGLNCFVDPAANQSVAFGLNCSVGPAALRSFASGNQCQANGLHSVAMGVVTIASGEGSVALGFQGHATGDTSFAVNQLTVASGASSAALGRLTTASGAVSLATGRSTVADGNYSAAFGDDCLVLADYGFVHGQGARSSRSAEYVHGAFTNASGVAGMFKRNLLWAISTNGTPQNLLLSSATELSVTDVQSYIIYIYILGSRTDAAATPGCLTHVLLASAVGGTLTIHQNVDLTPTLTAALPVGWAVTISAPGGLILRIAGNGAVGETVQFSARVEWNELPRA